MNTLLTNSPLVLGALIEEGLTFHSVPLYHSPVSFLRRHAIQHDASSVTLPMAKSKTATKKKKGISVSVLQGFGSPTSTAKTATSGGIINRSKSALLFYDILKANGGIQFKTSQLRTSPSPGHRLFYQMSHCTARHTQRRSHHRNTLRNGIGFWERKCRSDTASDTDFTNVLSMEKWRRVAPSFEGGGERKFVITPMLPPYQCSDCLGSTDFFSDTALEMMQSTLIVEETLSQRKSVKAR
eukprot:CCRYP_000537-RA/>CCRYP_000537-RA protein AED:0.00 eAED:0.00 QI:191/1/1/1/0/0/2/838/239